MWLQGDIWSFEAQETPQELSAAEHEHGKGVKTHKGAQPASREKAR
jgi:hypothetical protein